MGNGLDRGIGAWRVAELKGLRVGEVMGGEGK